MAKNDGRKRVYYLLLILVVMILWMQQKTLASFWHQKIIRDMPSVSIVAENFHHPWSLAFLPDGAKLITERQGKLWWLSADNQQRHLIDGLPELAVIGQGGLLDVVLHPNFAKNQWIYLSYAEGLSLNEPHINGLAVIKARLNRQRKTLDQIQVIFRQMPKVASSGHFGGRLVFANDGSLLITLGDRQTDEQRVYAQDLTRHNGKVIRVLDDGRIPQDNPFIMQAKVKPDIWSYGHRNIQGAALNPQTGELWISEHGPQGGDEINIVRAGRNYGWPIVTYGCEYGSCASIGEGAKKEGMEEPLTVWRPKSTAPSGLLFYTGNGFPEWQGQLLSGSLAGQTLWRMKTKDNKIIARHALPIGMRIRDVRQGNDGWIYLLTDEEQGKLLKLHR